VAGKNLAGAFKQPRLVLADTDTLCDLPEQEWRSGLAEIAKSAAIDSDEFFSWLEANAELLAQRDAAVVDEAVRRSAAFKARIVSGDEREEGLRECLNYGHTLGHAIEKVAGFGVVPHGVAVAEGVRFAARLGVATGQTDAAFVSRQDALLDRLGLVPLERAWSTQEMMQAMRSDKKVRGGDIRFVIPTGPGLWSCETVPDSVVRAHLEAWAASKER
jgi:3-dehydroquinate synthase